MKPVIILCGPTASGKTALALELAKRLNAEIISADSGQVYRGFDIGTAKPTPEEQARVRFHLIDIVDPDQVFSAADFRRLALEAMENIQSRGKKNIVVGGTGLYLKVLEDGIFEGPSAQASIRERLEDRLREEGIDTLYAELVRIDPVAAEGVQKRNKQRIIRALEVYEATGKTISEFWEEHPREQKGDFQKIGLFPGRDVLHQRIEERIDQMIQQGLIPEVESLVARWGERVPGLKLIGYKEVVAHLKGQGTEEEVIEAIKKNTRQYAKRQMTWFRKDSTISWCDTIEQALEVLDK